MKKKIKKKIKSILEKFDYKIVSKLHYNKLVQSAQQYESADYAKDSLLKSLFTIFKDQGYTPDTIYDVGANKGTWTFECLKFFPDAMYYLFEPQKNLEEDIKTLFKGHNSVQLFSIGLGQTDSKMNFTIHDRDDSCSFSFSKEEASARGFEQIELPIFRLDSFVKDNDLKPPNIIKIDAEGLDLQVLEGASGVLETVEVIMMEVAVVNNRLENSALKVLNRMELIGFKLFDITDLNRPFPNQVLWLCEFVFIKKGGALDKSYR
ncbi:FkbM family methyltransferase [Hyunsoonleella sp. SJ7]|uniref:FkbM family methyltransferase n=1 Tax=Hyunsoonleella aquatilis TaxID=2762758 RepID=A0A923KLB5_9FLAO|nr:FkbM family methyltransferase [Hyunsoonleella aquatilis]MBC3757745.1 FkbM family methyltransferase [Hyunsoonleella aquatilis]